LTKIKNKIIKFLKVACRLATFGSPQAVVYNFSVILFMLMVVPTAFFESLPIKCVWKTYIIPLFFHGHCPTSGIFSDCRCPGCGLTRGISSILHGDFSAGQDHNRLSIFVLLYILALILLNLIKMKKSTGGGLTDSS